MQPLSTRAAQEDDLVTQRDDILRALEEAGERGLTTGELAAMGIVRFGARIQELRKTHVIVKHRVTASRFRYELVGEIDSGWTTGAADSIPGSHGAAGTSFPRTETACGNPERLPNSAGGQSSSQISLDDGWPEDVPAMYREAA